jgi:hypothetical protein
VTGVTFAEPAFRQYVHLLHLQTRILLRQLPQNFTRPVRGPIIHNDKFGLHAALCK